MVEFYPADADSVSDKIRCCRKTLSKWKKECFHQVDKIKTQLLEAYKEEESYWSQRSRQTWLYEGDNNTKFFHASVQANRSRKRIEKLIDLNGAVQKSEASKGEVATTYFKDLFKSTNPSSFDRFFIGFQPKVTQSMNDSLIKPVSNDEIRMAVFSINPSSAPGSDGMIGLFFQKYWDIVGLQVSQEIQSFFINGSFPSDWNYTQLCLIPKVQNPSLMSELRPISYAQSYIRSFLRFWLQDCILYCLKLFQHLSRPLSQRD